MHPKHLDSIGKMRQLPQFREWVHGGGDGGESVDAPASAASGATSPTAAGSTSSPINGLIHAKLEQTVGLVEHEDLELVERRAERVACTVTTQRKDRHLGRRSQGSSAEAEVLGLS